MDAGKIGLGVDLYLDDQFSRGVTGVNKKLNTLNNKVSKTASAFQTFNTVSNGIQSLAQGLDTFVQPYVELEKQVRNIGTLGVENFQQFTDLATEASRKVPFSAAQIAQGTYQAISAGIKGTNEEIIEFTETASKAAVAGLSNPEAAVNALTSVLNAYGKTAADAGEVSDTFFAAIKLGKTSFPQLNRALANVIPAASAAKVNFDEVAASIATMTTKGVPTVMASTQIRQALVELQKPTGEMAKLFDKAGITSQQVAKSLQENGLIETLQTVQETASEHGKTLTQVFGSTEAASAALLLTGDNYKDASEAFKNVQEEVKGKAGEKAFEVASESIAVKTQLIINKVQSFFNEIFNIIGPGFVTFMSTASQVIPMFAQMPAALIAGRQAMELFRGSAVKLGATLHATLGVYLIPLIAAIGVLVGAYMLAKKGIASFQDVVSGAEEPKTGFWGFIQRIGGVLVGLGEIMESLSESGFALSNDTKTALEKMGILDFVIALGTWAVRIKAFFGGLISGITQAFSFIGDVFKKIWNFFRPVLDAVGAIEFFMEKNTSAIQNWAKWGKRLGMVIVGLIAVAFAPLIVVIGKVIAIGALLVGAFKLIWSATEWVGDNWKSWVDSMRSMWQNFVSSIQSYFMNLINFWTYIPRKLVGAGINMVKGLWKGIKSAWPAILKGLEQLVKGIPVIGERLWEALAGGTPEGGSAQQPKVSVAENVGSQIQQANSETQAAIVSRQASGNTGGGTTVNNNRVTEEIRVQLDLDGDTVAQSVVNRENDVFNSR